MEEKTREKIRRWRDGACRDGELASELAAMTEEELSEAFSKDLSFGTAGLRGIMGPGTNRMNIYTVARASKGLAEYLLKKCASPSVALDYDSRKRSRLFAETAAGVFAASGIHVYMYPVLMPTPCLSWAVRRLSCDAGVNITASHNPAEYNGYKVYGADGGQITQAAADKILAEIEKQDLFETGAFSDFAEGRKRGLIEYISPDIAEEYLKEVKKLSMFDLSPEDKAAPIAYSPLNGAGLVPVLRVLSDEGYTNITVAAEQEKPDGDFPTCPYPNPENRAAMELVIKYARECGAGLAIATDPDCDRVGVAVRSKAQSADTEDEYVLLTGNEIAILLLDYICSHRPDCRAFAEQGETCGQREHKPVLIKTVVSAGMAETVARHYGLRVINVLTGFKYVGEQIGLLEAAGREDDFVFGFEESYGYLSGTHVRDKDGVNAVLLICEMYAYYKARGMSLLDRLDELYKFYGYHIDKGHSYEFPGLSGFERMQDIMKKLRKLTAGFEEGSAGDTEFCGRKILECLDFSKSIDGLPKTDMIKLTLSGGCSLILRPSGTEPKLKLYVSARGVDMESACAAEAEIARAAEARFGL